MLFKIHDKGDPFMKKLWFLLIVLALLLCSCLPNEFFTPTQDAVATETTPIDNTLENTTPVETTPVETTTEAPELPEVPHEHVYDQSPTTSEPTCVDFGFYSVMCVCGDRMEVYLEPTGVHTYGEPVVTKEPTCTEEGETTATCTICKATQTAPIAATGVHIYWNAECIYCKHSTVTIYGVPSTYDADGDGENDIYNFSPVLMDGYQNAIHISAGDFDAKFSQGPSSSSAEGISHWFVAENSGNYLVYKVTVPETGVYEMILHLRLKDAQVRGTKYTVNAGSDNEQSFETSYGYTGMNYSKMRNDTHGIYMYGVTVNLVAGENTIKIEHASACPKSQHYRDFYFVKVGEYHAHEFVAGEFVQAPTCTEDGTQLWVCSCGDTQTRVALATREHSYVNDVCTMCGKEYVPTGITNYAFLSSKPGFAGGTVTFWAETSEVYTFWWADANGPLADYTMLYSDEFAANTESEVSIQSFTAIPKGATRLLAMNADKTIVYTYTIPESRRFDAKELYVFGAISDTHQGTRYGSTSIPYNHFINASKVLYEKGAIAIGICGDFSYNNTEDEYILHADAVKEIYQTAPDMPIFTTSGNHESKYTGFSHDWYMQYSRTMVDYDSDLTYLYFDGNELDYVVELPDGSVMIYFHQVAYDYGKSTSRLVSDEQLVWLEARLEQYKDVTVFFFFHTFMDEQVGDATSSGNEYSLPLISSTVEYQKFTELFTKYTNVVYFSGHSHWTFDSQFVEPKPGKTNYDKNIDDMDGTFATMVHIPACSTPRVLTGSGSGRSEGYIVHVYEDCIVLEGYEFVKGETFAYATYIIEK